MRRSVALLIMGVLFLAPLVALADEEAGGGARLPPAEEEIQAMQSAFAGVTEFLASLIREFKMTVDSLRARDEGLEAKYRALAVQLKDLEARISQLGTQVADHEQRIKRLESQDLGYLQRKVLGLEQAIQALQAKIENNRAKVEGFEETLADLSSRVSANEESISSLTSRMGQLEADFGAYRDELGAQLEELRGNLGMVQGLAVLSLLVALGALALYLLAR